MAFLGLYGTSYIFLKDLEGKNGGQATMESKTRKSKAIAVSVPWVIAYGITDGCRWNRFHTMECIDRDLMSLLKTYLREKLLVGLNSYCALIWIPGMLPEDVQQGY